MVDDDRYFLRPCRPRCGAAPASASVRPPPTAKDDTAQTTARTKTVATEQIERTDTDEEIEPADFKSQSDQRKQR